MEAFWKPEPRPPFEDWRTYSMLIPILSSALGACLFLALGFSFTEIATIPQRIRTGLVIVASFTVAFGSTFGSVGSGIEIFRKVHTGQVQGWDWVSLGISTATTIAGFGMGFAALLGATAQWSQVAVIYGSLVVGTLAALDSSGDMIELGGLFGSYEDRYEQWLAEREQWRAENGPEAEILTWPVAKVSDFEQICNGNGAHMTEDDLKVKLNERGLRMPSRATVRRWLS